MPALSFSKLKFVNMILTGKKPFTIRENTERNRRLFQLGKPINFYYKQLAKIESKPVDINGNRVHCFARDVKCLGAFKIFLSKYGYQINDGIFNGLENTPLYGLIKYNNISPDINDRLAKLDGFDSWQDMKDFFELEKGDREMLLILWGEMKRELILRRCEICEKSAPIHLLERMVQGKDGITGEILPDKYYHQKCIDEHVYLADDTPNLMPRGL